ncbi:MAG TPA: hypothetical protein ENN80_00715, partial [Candidatus Hydrogenedentes bacterium]|nr:hypothetical protein [Candidatus Hydrogenedentota bacterium]
MKYSPVSSFPAFLVIAAAFLVATAGMREAFATAAGDLDAAFDALAGYTFEQQRDVLAPIEAAVRASHKNAALREDLESRLIAILEEGAATLEGKHVACRQLALVGTEAAVPALGKMLVSLATVDMARYALECMPCPEADRALLNALPKMQGAARVGIINTLGERRSSMAVEALAEIVSSEDRIIAEAALTALGKIGGAAAEAALDHAHEVSIESDHVRLAWADKLRTDGEADAALAVYDALLEHAESPGLRVGAFAGKVATLGAEAAPILVDALRGSDEALAHAAIMSVRGGAGTGVGDYVALLDGMPPARRALLILALGDRGDKTALEGVMPYVDSDEAEVRLAALEALGTLGDASCLEPLALASVTTRTREVRETARGALVRLTGEGIEEALRTRALDADADAAVRAELIRCLASRYDVSATPGLLAVASNASAPEPVRVASFKSLAVLASSEELPALVELLGQVDNSKLEHWAALAVLAVAQETPDEKERVALMLDAFKGAQTPGTKAAICKLLGQLGDEAYLDVLRQAWREEKGAVQEAALRALADWSDRAALDDLAVIVSSAESELHRSLALRGMLRTVARAEGISDEERLAFCLRAFAAAENVQDKKLVLARLGALGGPEARGLIEQYLTEPELAQEAALALRRNIEGTWTAFASHGREVAPLALDLDIETRWTTGAPQEDLMSFVVDLGKPYEVSRVVLDTSPSPNDYPRGYRVCVSDDPADWRVPVAEGKGAGPRTTLAFEPRVGRYVIFVLTEDHADAPWSIHEVRFVDAESGKAGL